MVGQGADGFLSIRHLVKEFVSDDGGTFRAVDDISLDIRKGEIFATIIAVFMPLVSEYLGIAVSVYRTFHKVDGTTVLDSLASVPLNLSDPDILRGIIINLVIGYVLFAIGFIRFTPKQKNQQQSQLPRL